MSRLFASCLVFCSPTCRGRGGVRQGARLRVRPADECAALVSGGRPVAVARHHRARALALLTATKMPRLRGIALIATLVTAVQAVGAIGANVFPDDLLLAARIEGCGGQSLAAAIVSSALAILLAMSFVIALDRQPARVPDGHSRRRSRCGRACGRAGARHAGPFGGGLRGDRRDRQRRVVAQQRGDPRGDVLPAGFPPRPPLRRGRRMLYAFCDEPRRSASALRQADRRHRRRSNRPRSKASTSRASPTASKAWRSRRRGRRAPWSPTSPASRRCIRRKTGIVDSHALMLALQGDLEAAGGVIAFRPGGARSNPAGWLARQTGGPEPMRASRSTRW